MLTLNVIACFIFFVRLDGNSLSESYFLLYYVLNLGTVMIIVLQEVLF